MNSSVAQTPPRRIVTHDMAREAYFKLHDHVYNGKKAPHLTIPPSENDVDMILCDYIRQQEAKDAPTPATTAGEPLDQSQQKLVIWGTECFGADHMADHKVRALRLLEEAIEFAQSVEAPIEQCSELVKYVYSRPAGKPHQELGGIGVTWLVAAAALGHSAAEALRAEITRISQKPPSHFAKRNQNKIDAGFTGERTGSAHPDRKDK
jgi:hypothetical protein